MSHMSLDGSQAPTLEFAHILFMDIVGYSQFPIDHQRRAIRQLQLAVQGSSEFVKSKDNGDVLCIPTGDGMAIAFWRSPEAPVICAMEVSRALRQDKDFCIRIGVHSGPVYRIADINAKENLAGAGMNTAKRVMDCGDENHILLSMSIAEILRELSGWSGLVHSLGEVEVKHQVRIQLFNLYNEEIGNPSRPKGLQSSMVLSHKSAAPTIQEPGNTPQAVPGADKKPRIYHRLRTSALAGGGMLVLCLAAAAWYLSRPLPTLRIAQYTQITHDSRQKALIGTDGARLFVNIYPADQPLAEVSITGGAAAPITLAFPNPWVYDLSPDGTALLATSFDKDVGSLWSVGSAGSPLRHLADGNNGGIDGAAWSPDGKSVAYSTSNGDIHLMHTDGTGARVLGTVPYRTKNAMFEQISWSPDGKTIRFDRNNRIYEVKLDGSGPHPFLPGWRPTSWQCCGRWTADGSFYLFLVWDNPQNAYHLIPPFQIWVLDERHGLFPRGSAEPFQLTSGPTRWCRPVPGRDGKKIFARGVNLNGELDRLDQRSHQLQPYLGGISAEGVAFSSDGKSVAYVTYPEGVLWRADRDGNNRIQLTDPPLYPVLPRWSPDGSHILFAAADSAGAFHSYILSSQGGTPQPILPDPKESRTTRIGHPTGGGLYLIHGRVRKKTRNWSPGFSTWPATR